jgi:hypothetical protein
LSITRQFSSASGSNVLWIDRFGGDPKLSNPFSKNANIKIPWARNTIFRGSSYLQMVIEIITCKPLAQFLRATSTPS